MALSAIARKEVSSRLAAYNRRLKVQNLENLVVRHASGIGTAALLGTLNRMQVRNDIAGFPVKLGIGAAALLGEGLTKGATQAALAGVAGASLAIYVERAVSQNTLVAGDFDPDPDGAEL